MAPESNSKAVSPFVSLSLATTIATYLLITVGALVRAAGAGLGCPDWPRCFGGWIPPTSAADLPASYDPAQFSMINTWLEYGNRLVGVIIGLLIFATLVAAVVYHRRRRQILWPSVGAFILVGVQGWLGGQVVDQELEAQTLTLHMLLALIIVGLLQYAYLSARFRPLEEPVRSIPPSQRTTGRFALGAGALLLAQVAIGTHVRGALQRIEETRPELARSEWLPLGWWPDIAHRQLSFVVLAAIIGLAWWAARTARDHSGIRRWTSIAVGLVLAQVGAGFGLAYLDVPPVLQLFHLTLASLLFGALAVLVYQAYRVPPDS